MQPEQTETRSKKVRGKARRSLDLIEAMYAAAEAAQPITGRGIGYKLFTAGLIPSMAKNVNRPAIGTPLRHPRGTLLSDESGR
jgi:hypothetical protein